MEMSGIPLGITDWSKIERTEHKGESGSAYWRKQHFGDIRVRMVEIRRAISPITGASKATYFFARRANFKLNSKTVGNSL